MPPQLCRYIKTNGLQCQAISLRDERFCYFHAQLGRQHRQFRPNHVYDRFVEPGQSVRLPPVEDRDSLLMAISQAVGAIATNQISVRQGVAMLYGLQLAAHTIKCAEDRNVAPPNLHDLVSAVVKTVDHLYIAPDSPEATIIEAQRAQLAE
jgi:hypothetical protein